MAETVPTKSDCKDGGWQTMIDSAGNHFKNQGDCVSYFATKGKNLGAVAPAIATDVVAATNSDAASPQVKPSNKGNDQATGRHLTSRLDAKVKTKTHAGHGHGSHHSK